MMGFFCLAVLALILLGVDADTDANAVPDGLNRALCEAKSRQCNADIPRSIPAIVDANGNLGVNCRTLDNDRTCLQSLMPGCEFLRTASAARFLQFDIKEYLCNNAAAFVRGRYCWPTRAMYLAYRDCGSTCRMQACLEERFLSIPECSDNEAALMGGVAAQFEKYERRCSNQTQQDTS